MPKDKPHSDIGRRLRAFRETLGMNQKDFAAAHGFNQTQYTNWETGTRRIPPDAAILLEDRYGLSLDFIFIGRLRTLPHSLAVSLADSPWLKRTSSESDKASSDET